MNVYRPSDEKQLAEVISSAAADNQAFEIVAGGSKRGLGRPTKAEHILDVSRISGIIKYEPAELILTARPGTPLAVIEAQLQAKGQMLAFEPPDWRGLLGSTGEPTLGGALACNFAGPRRVRAGAPRDFFLGFAAVNGRGEIWKAGGKVVKNVTGFDMSKLQAGAFGTLSVLTEATLKVMPKPETECTVLLHALADEVAMKAMSKALNTPFEVSSVAHLPAATARRSTVPTVEEGLGAVTGVRLEGPQPSVAFRADAIESIFGPGARLEDPGSRQFWREVGDVKPLLPEGARLVWRLCPTPSLASVVVDEVRASLPSADAFFDWGGGLVWLSLDAEEAGPDAGAAVVRGAVKRSGGNSTLVVAPNHIRETVPVFDSLEGPLADLTLRIKRGFDPQGVLNPGRMQEGH
jgi:glycolate oxidase FAD binding subunit